MFFAESRLVVLTVLVAVFLYEGAALANAVNAVKVPSCPAKPRVFADLANRTPESIPESKLLVGREVNLWIESADPQGLKLWVRHNFRNGRKEFVCANIPPQVQENFSVPVLALHDQTVNQKTGDAVWQLQVMVRDRELGLWSQKSGLMDSKALLSPQAQPRWYGELTGEKMFLNERQSGIYKIQSLVEFDPGP